MGPQTTSEQQAAQQEPVHQVSVTETPAADDPATWDVSSDSLFPLLGGGGHETGTGAANEEARQEAAATTAVMAGAYSIARAVAADQALAEPVRPAWRPKASGGAMPVELSCAFDEPEEQPAEAARHKRSIVEEADEEEDGGRKRERDSKRSVADLLRQEEDAWGGAGQGSSVFG
ncbi:hypothetical protein [Streptomyces sp. NPDC048663]|uniref:hypothetical protein n=1 Tax=Streptomyces sp. NPDC048663 TaxID=3155638 RepID=UPI00343D18CD